MKLICFLFFILSFFSAFFCASNLLAAQETIISKKDTDETFEPTKPQWETAAKQFLLPLEMSRHARHRKHNHRLRSIDRDWSLNPTILPEQYCPTGHGSGR